MVKYKHTIIYWIHSKELLYYTYNCILQFLIIRRFLLTSIYDI